MKVNDTQLEVLPPLKDVQTPSWERARTLWSRIKHSAEDIIALGMELEALRKQYLAQGARNDFVKGLNEVGSQPTERGWQDEVKAQLGMSYVTALEHMKKARYTSMMRDLAAGETVQYLDSKNNVRELVPGPETCQLAEKALYDVVGGVRKASRAWAGLVGEGTRRQDGAKKTGDRAPVDHYEVLKGALKSMRNSLKHWRALEPGQRAELETLWADVSSKLPETWIG